MRGIGSKPDFGDLLVLDLVAVAGEKEGFVVRNAVEKELVGAGGGLGVEGVVGAFYDASGALGFEGCITVSGAPAFGGAEGVDLVVFAQGLVIAPLLAEDFGEAFVYADEEGFVLPLFR